MTELEIECSSRLRTLPKKRSSHNVVQMSDEFNSNFDDDFAVHSLCSCGPGALVHAV